jgi:arginine deiminase
MAGVVDTNLLAIAPGVVLGYDRNTATNAMLRDHGLEVIPLASSELMRRARRRPLHELPHPA